VPQTIKKLLSYFFRRVEDKPKNHRFSDVRRITSPGGKYTEAMFIRGVRRDDSYSVDDSLAKNINGKNKV
jgi:hypothetical protein